MAPPANAPIIRLSRSGALDMKLQARESKLVQERKRLGWTRDTFQAELGKRMKPGAHRHVISVSQIGIWERSGYIGSAYWVELVCEVYGKTAEALGLFVPGAAPQPLSPPAPGATQASGDAWVAPRDIAILPLPPASSGLVGRDDEREWLDTHLLAGKTAGIWAFAGMGGVGKTTIVADALKRLWPRFTGGVAVIRANEISDVYVILRQLVEKFVPHARRVIDEAPITRSTLRTALTVALTDLVARNHRVLVAIDNVEHDVIPKIQLVLDILRAVGASVVITSREEIDHRFLDAKREVGILSDDAACALFAALALGGGVAPTTDQANAIAAICALVGNHAQALVLAAADFDQRPLHTVQSYRDHLEKAPNAVLDLYDRLDAQAPTGVRLTFASSYKWLPAEAQRVFVLFGALGGPSVALAAIQEVAATIGLAEQTCLDALDTLIRAKLIRLSAEGNHGAPGDARGQQRLELHPLVQLFARELLADLDGSRQSNIHEAFAWRYARWIQGKPEHILRPDDANILAALSWATTWATTDEARHTELIAQLARGLEQYWRQRLQYDFTRQWLPGGLVAVEQMGDAWLPDRAAIAHSLARAYYHDGQIANARAHYERSLRAFEELRDLAGQGLASHSLGILTMHHGTRKEAREYLLQSLKARRQARDKAGEAQSLCSLGFLVMTTAPATADHYFRQSLTIRRALELRRDVGITLRGLGRLAYLTGDYANALPHFSESLRIFRELHFRQDEAIVLRYLGDIHRVEGRLQQAREFYLDSLELSTEIGELESATTVYYLLGVVALTDDIDSAHAYFLRCLDNATRTHHAAGKATAWLGLGLVAERQGDMRGAEGYLRDAYALADEANNVESLADITESLARLLLRLDPVRHRSEATRLLKQALRQYVHLGQLPKVAQVKQELQAMRTVAS